MLNIICFILLVISLIYSAYFIVMGFGILKKGNKNCNANKKHKFAIIIAARNEELVIGNLINSLQKQDYPSNKYEIFVIINNCTDNTEKVALSYNVNVINCDEKVSSKGQVLKFAYNKLKDRKDIEVYAIFDADNLVHKDFLKFSNEMLNKGYNVAQGFRDTKNISDNWISSSYAILYYLQSLFINGSRYNLGKSAFLNGTGFIVKKDIIDKYGFDPITVTEDIEFTAMCAINDEKIGFMENAITYDEQVTGFKSSIKQRKRWSFGTMECLKKYFPILLKKGIKEKKFECFDVAIFFLAVIVHVLFCIIQLYLLISFSINIRNYSLNQIIFFFIALLITYLFGVIVRIIILKKYNKRIKDYIGGVFLFDLFVISWLPVNFICLFIKKCNWDQIVHNKSVKIENM